LTSTGRRTERRTRPDPHATVSRACVRRLRLELRKPTAFPSSATFGHPLSSARAITAEEAATTETEPTKAFVPTTPREERCLPENRDAFFRHDTRRIRTRRDCSLRPSRRLSRSRRPHFVPRLGRVFCLGLASVTVRSPAIRDVPSADGSRVQSPLLLPASRLGLTTQARR
jgi:hypothetical protein